MPKLALTDMAVGCVTYCAVSSKPDLSNCRLCFAEDSDLINIFEESGSSTNVVQTIYETLNYKVTKQDQFPPFICLDCLQKLSEFKEFKRKCDSRKQTYELILSARADNLKPVCTKVPPIPTTLPVRVVEVSTGKKNDFNASRRNGYHPSPEYLTPGRPPGSLVHQDGHFIQVSTLRRSRRPASLRSLSYRESPGSPVSPDGSDSQDSEHEPQDEIEENDQVSRQKRIRRHVSPKSQPPGELPEIPVPQEGPVEQKTTLRRSQRNASTKSQLPLQPPEVAVSHDGPEPQASTPKRTRRQITPKQHQSPGEPPEIPVPKDSTVVQEFVPELQNVREDDYRVTKRWRSRRHASPKTQSPGQPPSLAVSQDSPVVQVTKRKRNQHDASPKHLSPGQPLALALPLDGPVNQESVPEQQNEIEENDQKETKRKRNERHASLECQSPGQLPGLARSEESPVIQASTPKRTRRQITPKQHQSPGEPSELTVPKDSTVVQVSEPEVQNEIEENDQVSTTQKKRRQASPKPLSPTQLHSSTVPQDLPVFQESVPELENEIRENDEDSVPVLQNEIEENDQESEAVLQNEIDDGYQFPIPEMAVEGYHDGYHGTGMEFGGNYDEAPYWSSDCEDVLIPAEMVEVVEDVVSDHDSTLEFEATVTEEADQEDVGETRRTPGSKQKNISTEESAANRNLESTVTQSEGVAREDNPGKVLMPLHEDGQIIKSSSAAEIKRTAEKAVKKGGHAKERKENEETTEERKRRNREAYQRKMAKETAEQKAARLERCRLRMREYLKNMTPEEQQKNKEAMAKRKSEKRKELKAGGNPSDGVNRIPRTRVVKGKKSPKKISEAPSGDQNGGDSSSQVDKTGEEVQDSGVSESKEKKVRAKKPKADKMKDGKVQEKEAPKKDTTADSTVVQPSGESQGSVGEDNAGTGESLQEAVKKKKCGRKPLSEEERKRRKREAYQRKIAKETAEQKAARLERCRLYMREYLKNMTPEERQKYKENMAKRKPEKPYKRRPRDEKDKEQRRAAYQRWLAKETPEQKAIRLERDRQRKKEFWSRLTPEEQRKRNAYHAERLLEKMKRKKEERMLKVKKKRKHRYSWESETGDDSSDEDDNIEVLISTCDDLTALENLEFMQ